MAVDDKTAPEADILYDPQSTERIAIDSQRTATSTSESAEYKQPSVAELVADSEFSEPMKRLFFEPQAVVAAWKAQSDKSRNLRPLSILDAFGITSDAKRMNLDTASAIKDALVEKDTKTNINAFVSQLAGQDIDIFAIAQEAAKNGQ